MRKNREIPEIQKLEDLEKLYFFQFPKKEMGSKNRFYVIKCQDKLPFD